MSEIQAQDSTDPTGVAVVEGKHSKELTRARDRKANMAYKMSLSGANWKLIATTCGYPTPRAAKVAVERMWEKRLEPADKQHLRLLVAGRLDTLLRSVWPDATEPSSDKHLAAVGRARELVADYRKVFGIDAPQEILVTSPTQRDMDELVAGVIEGTLPTVGNADIVDAELVTETVAFDAVSD